MQHAQKHSRKRAEDRELKQWLRETIRHLKQPGPPHDELDEDPFADPAVRARVAQLIARAHKDEP